jgi:hypothetical protein
MITATTAPKKKMSERVIVNKSSNNQTNMFFLVRSTSASTQGTMIFNCMIYGEHVDIIEITMIICFLLS